MLLPLPEIRMPSLIKPKMGEDSLFLNVADSDGSAVLF
jgi:hypothetical protein